MENSRSVTESIGEVVLNYELLIQSIRNFIYSCVINKYSEDDFRSYDCLHILIERIEANSLKSKLIAMLNTDEINSKFKTTGYDLSKISKGLQFIIEDRNALNHNILFNRIEGDDEIERKSPNGVWSSKIKVNESKGIIRSISFFDQDRFDIYAKNLTEATRLMISLRGFVFGNEKIQQVLKEGMDQSYQYLINVKRVFL